MASSKVKVTIYLARHGECSGNVAQKFIDPFTDNLTAVGQAQAELLGKHLKDVPFTDAFASDYPRAEQTAKAVLKESISAKENGVELKTDNRLRERGYTGLLGIAAKDAINMMYDIMKKGTPFLKVDIENCENTEEFEKRIVSFFSELIEKLRLRGKDEETILLVSHGLTIQRLMVLLNTRPECFGICEWTGSTVSERQMRNTTFHKLQLEIPKITTSDGAGITGHVEAVHCRDHIKTDDPIAKEQAGVKDTGNYTFLEQSGSFEEETVHYCKPV